MINQADILRPRNVPLRFNQFAWQLSLITENTVMFIYGLPFIKIICVQKPPFQLVKGFIE